MVINFILNPNIENKKEIIYTIYYLTKNFNTEIKISYSAIEDAVNVYYGVECSSGIYIPCCSEHNRLVYNVFMNETYAVFDKKLDSPFHKEGCKIVFDFDILFISKYLIISEEEYEFKDRDDRDRFTANLSMRKENVNIPFFDVNTFIIIKAINELDASVSFKKKEFEIFLTHDVDSLNSRDKYVFLHNAKSLITDKTVGMSTKFKELISDLVHNRHLQIDNYIDIETKRNAKSEFYFITGVKHRLGKRYDLNNVEKQLKRLKDSPSHIIGIHTNYFSYKDRTLIKDEINEIESKANVKVKSCRNHYLRFEIPTTWKELSSCSIISDSTMGYSDINGFRAGFASSYVPFDHKENKLIDIFETPLIVMDGIVMPKPISFEEKWKEIKQIIDYVIKYNGTASVLFHQRVIYNDEYKAMYEKIMDYVVSNNGKFVLSSDFEDRKNKDIDNLNKLFLSLE